MSASPGGEDPYSERASPGSEPSAGLSGSLAAATERIQLIIDAAERAAGEIRDDAREQAERYVQESRGEADRMAKARIRQMAELTDALVDQASQVRQRSDELIAALDIAARELVEGGGAPEPGTGVGAVTEETHSSPSPPVPDPVSPEPAPHRTPRGGQGLGPVTAARLLAAQMSVGGSDREEIAQRLRDELGIEDPEPILDEMLGDESS